MKRVEPTIWAHLIVNHQVVAGLPTDFFNSILAVLLSFAYFFCGSSFSTYFSGNIPDTILGEREAIMRDFMDGFVKEFFD